MNHLNATEVLERKKERLVLAGKEDEKDSIDWIHDRAAKAFNDYRDEVLVKIMLGRV